MKWNVSTVLRILPYFNDLEASIAVLAEFFLYAWLEKKRRREAAIILIIY